MRLPIPDLMPDLLVALHYRRDRRAPTSYRWCDRRKVAGGLHDIGKIGVADSILCKPGPLTDAEHEAMKRHPEIGAWILDPDVADIQQWVLAHHEQPDGHGYPFGLGGDSIPVEARILAVADAYEAMTTDRVYRTSVGAEAACAELRRCAGTQFDSQAVDALLDCLAVRDGL